MGILSAVVLLLMSRMRPMITFLKKNGACRIQESHKVMFSFSHFAEGSGPGLRVATLHGTLLLWKKSATSLASGSGKLTLRRIRS